MKFYELKHKSSASDELRLQCQERIQWILFIEYFEAIYEPFMNSIHAPLKEPFVEPIHPKNGQQED